MKNKVFKKVAAMSLATVMTLGTLAGCGSSETAESDAGANQPATEVTGATAEAASTDGGTIMWLSNISSGPQYDAAVAYAKEVCTAMGYEFTVVFGDSFNDPDGNLTAVKNAMTSDVVALVASQDGGIQNIMDEYPNLYVAGYNTDMNAVYGEGGAAAALQQNEKFLGTICDGYYDGTLLGEQMAEAVIANGYTKVSTIAFPAYAYPNLAAADAGFRAAIAAHNETAATPIEIVGESKVLEFAPLEESYFLEEGNADLDAIVGFCAGVDFIYPCMKTAIANGTCAADTKLITGGLNTDETIIADMGGEGVIQYVSVSPNENIGWSLVMLDKALKGDMFVDYTGNERINSLEYVIDSQEDAQNVVNKSILAGTEFAQITAEELMAVTSYAELKELFMSEQLTVDALANR